MGPSGYGKTGAQGPQGNPGSQVIICYKYIHIHIYIYIYIYIYIQKINIVNIVKVNIATNCYFKYLRSFLT